MCAYDGCGMAVIDPEQKLCRKHLAEVQDDGLVQQYGHGRVVQTKTGAQHSVSVHVPGRRRAAGDG